MEKILVAYDGEEPAKRALRTAIELAKKFDGLIGVVSVVPFHPGRVPVDPWDDRPVHTQELIEAREILRAEGIEADFIEPYGDPAQTIQQVAEDGGYDTIVVGSRGLGTAARVLRGSVSEHVATHAAATVIIAR